MRRRVIAMAVLVAVVAVALFLLPLCIAIARNQRNDDGRELVQIAALAASRVPDGYASGDAFHPSGSGLETDQSLAVYGPSGQLVAGEGPPALEAELAAVLADRLVDRRIGSDRVVAVPIVSDDGSIGAVRVSEPSSVSASRVHRLWAGAIAAGLVAIAVTWLVAVLLARRLTKPVGRLVDEAHRIGEGDFTVVVEPTGMAEIDELGAALTATSARIGRLVEREQALTADASHQLRTPLAGLRLTIESELEHPRADPTVALQLALVDVDRLEATIEQLLTLAREVPGTSRPPIDLAPTLRSLAGRWRGRLVVAGRAFTMSGAEAPLITAISPAAAEHVLDVLLDNALRHGAGRVTMAATSRHDHAVITVTDEGHGVEHPEQLFQRRAPDATGTGIGLALARRLAEAEGARLRYDGGETTVFRLLLPR
jgi:signal transduction histidine kinase